MSIRLPDMVAGVEECRLNYCSRYVYWSGIFVAGTKARHTLQTDERHYYVERK